MYCLVMYVDMNGEGGWGREYGSAEEPVVSGSVEQFCQKVTVHAYYARALFTDSMSAGPLFCLHVRVLALCWLGGL